MIPTLIFCGLLSGRWWVIAAAALVWPALLISSDVMSVELGLLAAALLAVVNTALGVAVHKALATLLRLLWRRIRRPEDQALVR